MNNITYIEYGFEQHQIKWWETISYHEIDLKKYYANYANITSDNITYISLLTAECVNEGTGGTWGSKKITYNYSPNTGILTMFTNNANFCLPVFLITIEE